MRVEPEITSAPTSATIAMSAAACKRRAMIAGDCSGVSAACACIGDGGDNIGRAAGSGEADDDIFAGRAAAGDIALAEFFGIFIDFDGGGEGLGAAGHDVLHLPGAVE